MDRRARFNKIGRSQVATMAVACSMVETLSFEKGLGIL
jgi:hypothetical protein